jgi:hypothetical protein
MIHLAPTTTNCDAVEAMSLLLTTVVRLHGLPAEIVSDRGTQFTATFYAEVARRWGIKQSLSSTYHPESDGQTERVNQVIKDYLRHYVGVNQTDWEEQLAMAEFAYNNSYHSATKTTPFQLNYGFEPLTPLSLLSASGKRQRASAEALFADAGQDYTCPAAQSFNETMAKSLTEARKWLEAARQRDKKYADPKRTAVTYEQGDRVLLSTKNLSLIKEGSRKLLPRFVGPFTIAEKVNEAAYRLHLPVDFKQRCHTFHVHLLKKWHGTDQVKIPPLPIVYEGETEWIVDHIVNHKDVSNGKGRPRKRAYLVRWEGYPSSYDTWEPESHLVGCPKLLEGYRKSLETLKK